MIMAPTEKKGKSEIIPPLGSTKDMRKLLPKFEDPAGTYGFGRAVTRLDPQTGLPLGMENKGPIEPAVSQLEAFARITRMFARHGDSTSKIALAEVPRFDTSTGANQPIVHATLGEMYFARPIQGESYKWDSDPHVERVIDMAADHDGVYVAGPFSKQTKGVTYTTEGSVEYHEPQVSHHTNMPAPKTFVAKSYEGHCVLWAAESGLFQTIEGSSDGAWRPSTSQEIAQFMKDASAAKDAGTVPPEVYAKMETSLSK